MKIPKTRLWLFFPWVREDKKSKVPMTTEKPRKTNGKTDRETIDWSRDQERDRERPKKLIERPKRDRERDQQRYQRETDSETKGQNQTGRINQTVQIKWDGKLNNTEPDKPNCTDQTRLNSTN